MNLNDVESGGDNANKSTEIWILRVSNIDNNESIGDKHTAACKLGDTA